MRPTGKRVSLLIVLLLAFAGALHPAMAGSQALFAGSGTPAGYDLERDERLGGHTLARHVGKTDAELADRLRREPQTRTASTYIDVATARRVIAAALDRSRNRVRAWESRRGNRPNLVVDYIARELGPIGRSLSRGRRRSDLCDRARVVLRWLERERRWIVLTSYPEAGR